MEEEEQREGEGEWSARKGSPKKESEWSERAETACGCGRNGVDMEGDKFSGKAQLSAQTSGTLQPDLFIFFSVIGCVCSARAGLCFPPLWYFPLSHAASVLTACFRWVLDLGLGALQGLCSSLAAVWLICLYRLRRLCCLLFVSPRPTVVSHIAVLS